MDHLGLKSVSSAAGRGSKGLKISIIGHCIICLRKLKTVDTTSGGKCKNKVSGLVEEVEVAKKLVVSQPGFLATFNEIWTVFQHKASDTNDKTESGEISLEKVNNLITRPKISVNFPSAPPMCEQCCGKVVNVENLMKAVRQQIREIQMLLEGSREGGRFGGRMEEFGKTLRENKVEEDVILATLRFVQMLGCPEEKGSENEIATTTTSIKSATRVTTTPMECDEDNSCGNESGDSEDDGTRPAEDLEDFIKLEEEEDDDEVPLEEEPNPDPDPVCEADDPLMPRIYTCDCGKIFSTRDGMNKHKKHRCGFNPVIRAKLEKGYKFECSCGRRFPTKKGRYEHMVENVASHPNFKPSICSGKGQRCDMCDAPILFSNILEHLTNHVGAEYVVKCPNDKCRHMFSNSKGLQLHFGCKKYCKKIGMEKNAGLVCETCGFTADHVMNIRSHLKNAHELVGTSADKRWKCPVSGCSEMFCVKQSIYFHLQVHRNQKIKISNTQKCHKCGEDIKVEEMEGHLKDKYGILEVDLIGCKQCTFKFSGRGELVEHLHKHLKDGIICDICRDGDGDDDKQEKWFVYGDFREHYFGVHGLCEKKYKCDECGKYFWRNQMKNVHKCKVHNIKVVAKPKKRFACELCLNSVTYISYVNLLSHKIKVHGADPFVCDICEEKFDERGKLCRHKMEKHEGVKFQKEWKCEVEGCGKIFKGKMHWKMHMKGIHGDDGGHCQNICEECGKLFISATRLKIHFDSVHLGKRPWICEECGESFTSGAVLKKHKLIHTGERPFGCEICGQRFRHKDVLKKHLKNHEEKGKDFKPNGPMKQIRKRRVK